MIASSNLSSDLVSEFSLDSTNAEAATSRVLNILALEVIDHVVV